MSDQVTQPRVSVPQPPAGRGQDARMDTDTNLNPIGWARRARTGRIERRATALDKLTTATRQLADVTMELAAARELDTETRPDTKPPIKHVTAVAVLVGLPVIALALLGTLVAVGLGTEFWATRLPASARSVQILGMPGGLDLTKAVPVGAEGVVWGLTLMAIILVTYRVQYGAWTRPMWVVATAVASINGVHNATYDLIGGLGLGALSISSPYLIHKYVLFVRALKDGKTIAEALAEGAARWRAIGRGIGAFLIAILDFLLHPLITVAAVLLWRMHRGISYSHAHRTVVAHFRDRRAATEDAPYGKHLIDLIDPVDVDGRIAKTAPVKRRPAPAPTVAVPAAEPVVPAPVVVDDEPVAARHAKPAGVVSIQHPAGRPDWVTNDMSPSAAMAGYLERHGDTQGALLDRWATDLGLSTTFKPGLGRTVLNRWRTAADATAVGGE